MQGVTLGLDFARNDAQGGRSEMQGVTLGLDFARNDAQGCRSAMLRGYARFIFS